jgi:hypothetical protein
MLKMRLSPDGQPLQALWDEGDRTVAILSTSQSDYNLFPNSIFPTHRLTSNELFDFVFFV